MTSYVLAGYECQKQYCYWDDFQKLHVIHTSPILFYQYRDGDDLKTCVSEDSDFMQDQADRENSCNFAAKYSQYEGASWTDYYVCPMDDFRPEDIRRGYELP